MATWTPYMDKVYDPLMAGSIDGTDKYPHDRAICRAMAAKYKPNKLLQGDPRMTLFVARLTPGTSEETLYSAFRQFGKIKNVRLVRDMVTGFSKCYGFVEFESEKSLREVLSAGQMTVDDKEILIDHERSRTLKNWVPRRLGGGFGGMKESGQLRFGGVDRPFRRPLFVASDSKTNYSASRPSDSGEYQRNHNTHDSSREYSQSRRYDDSRQRQNEYSNSSRRNYSDSSKNYNDRRDRQRSRSPQGRQSYSRR